MGSSFFKSLFSLCCLAFVAWEAFGFGLRSLRFFGRSSTGESTYQLDSFSEPSVAGVILKQEAQRLELVYTRQRIEIMNKAMKHPKPDCTPMTRASNWVSICQLQALQSEISDLEADLDGKLMMIYYENDLWNEFLDRYLHYIHSHPQSTTLVNLAWPALACSKACNRTDELLQELELVTRFHPGLKTIPCLKETLAQWNSSTLKRESGCPAELRAPMRGSQRTAQ